ncbi:MAG: acyltransferase family protein [Bryobacteraceae bacterium]
MPRLQSLDAFRGLTIALMILVNTPGDGRHVYAPLRHAEWHGWTITDCIFPSFVWIVGVAITLSLGRKLDQPRPAIYKVILRRAAILFGLGLLIYAFPTFPLDTFRILGVLQRIAICYAVTAVIFLNTSIRGHILATLALLGGYWAIMTFIPSPGFAAGDLTVEGNFSHYIDRIVLGAHNYSETRTWDPEGIVSTLPSIASCLLGVLAGHIVKASASIERRTQRLLIAGVILIAAGLVLHPLLPINKKLWTSSFTLLMAGLDFAIFGALLWIIDGKRIVKPFRPAIIMGMNAIALYLASEFIEISLQFLHWKKPIYETVFLPLASPINASLLYAVTYTGLHLVLAYSLYRRNLFFRA